MKLYVMRHGPAEENAASGIDADRSLTTSGRERVRAVAKTLLDAGEEPARIISSPLVRSVQTAEIVAITTRLASRDGTVEIRRELAPGGAAAKLAHALAAEGAKRVMMVGHEPDLSALVIALLGSFSRPFDKAMVVAIHPVGSLTRTRLRFVLEPKSLKLETGESPT